MEVAIPVAYSEMAWPVGLSLLCASGEFTVAGRCVRCQAVDIDPEDATSKGPSLLSALATCQGGTSGPTFGLLLKRKDRECMVLELGMALRG